MFKRILVAIDGSATASRGLRVAIELAADQRADVYVLHVVDDMSIVPGLDGGYVPSAYIDSYALALRDRGRKALDKAHALAASGGVACKPVLVETLGATVAHTILQQARKLRADLIVLGTHGRRGLRRLLLGSDAETVLREATVPVLLVRGSESAAHARREPAAGAGKVQSRAARAQEPVV